MFKAAFSPANHPLVLGLGVVDNGCGVGDRHPQVCSFLLIGRQFTKKTNSLLLPLRSPLLKIATPSHMLPAPLILFLLLPAGFVEMQVIEDTVGYAFENALKRLTLAISPLLPGAIRPVMDLERHLGGVVIVVLAIESFMGEPLTPSLRKIAPPLEFRCFPQFARGWFMLLVLSSFLDIEPDSVWGDFGYQPWIRLPHRN